MANRKLLVEVISPEEVLYAAEADMVVARTAEGEVGILPLHTQMVCLLTLGEVRIKYGDHIDYFVIDAGFLEVREDKVVIITSSALPVSKIDPEAEMKAREEALKATQEAKEKGEDLEELRKTIERASVRLKILEKAQKS